MNAAVDPYEQIQYYNHEYGDHTPMLVTRRAFQALELLRVRLGYKDPLTMYQGCYHTGVSQSAQTHWGADVFDISAHEFERTAKIGAEIGIIVFHRPFNWDGDGGMEHCHILIKGSSDYNYQAAQQQADWDNHIDGLAGHDTRYPGPWYPVKDFEFKPEQPPTLKAFGAWPDYDDLAWGEGRTSDANLLVQAALITRGIYGAFDGADVDRTWTQRSQQALTRYLKHHPDLAAERTITPAVWQSLGSKPKDPVVSWPGAVPFKVGSSSTASLLQQALLVLNDKPAMDGYAKTLGYRLTHEWRPEAVQATKDFQLAHDALKADPDGVPGPTGWLIEYQAAA